MKKDKLDQILDGGGGSGSHTDGSSHPMSRKNSVALRALQRCLRDDPKYLYQVVEANLQGDFLGRAASAGEPRVPGTTVRGWLTSKSRIQNYQQHVRWCWALGGIWDALIEGRAEEARARCALMMCAADQAAIDGGNWLMSTVALLEPVATLPAVCKPPCTRSSRTPVLHALRPQVGGDLSYPPKGSGLVRGHQEEAGRKRIRQDRDRRGEDSPCKSCCSKGQEQGRESGESQSPKDRRFRGRRRKLEDEEVAAPSGWEGVCPKD